MASPKTRSHSRFRFNVASAKAVPVLEEQVRVPWPVAAIGGGALAALAGAVVVGGVVLTGWLGASSASFGSMLGFAGRVWLLAHGGTMDADGVTITVIPLGLSLLCAAFAAWAGSLAYRPQSAAGGSVRQRVLLTVVQVGLGYGVVAAAIGWAAGSEPFQAVPGSVLISVGGALVGASWRAGYRGGGPTWLRASAKGALAGVLGLVLVAAVALAAAMVQGETRIAALEQALGFDGGGLVVWALTCLLYLPNLLAWTAAWILGAGFTLGDGSLIAPWVTRLGLMPSVPIFGALPPDGSGSLAGWLAAGVVPGLLAGVGAVRAKVGGIAPAVAAGTAAGIVTGMLYLTGAMLSRGALGTARFAEVGPRVPEVLIGVAIVTLGAAVGSCAAWFIDRRVGSVG
jgi:hypothetical protein